MYKYSVLSNGVSIISEKIPYVRSVAFGIWIKTGSRHESLNNNGISHFLEHMLFKGTETRNAKQLADEMDGIGGQINAFTSKEYTCFYTITLYNHLKKALDILSDMLLNSKLSIDEINKEKGVILEEINMYEDSPDEVVQDILQENVWKNQSMGMSILGTKDTVNSITREKLLDYIGKYYTADNIILSIAGDFEEENLVDILEKYFSKIPHSNIEEEKANSLIKYNKSFVYRDKDIEQCHITLSFPGIELQNPFLYSLTVFNSIFGGGVSSYLFQKIREEKGLAYSIYSYSNSFSNCGLYNIYSALNTSQLEEFLTIALYEIEKMKTIKIEPEKIIRTKEHIKSNVILGLENTASIMSHMGRSQILFNKIRTPDEIIDKIDLVSSENITEVTNKVLDFDNLSISIVGRMNEIPLERISKLCKIKY